MRADGRTGVSGFRGKEGTPGRMDRRSSEGKRAEERARRWCLAAKTRPIGAWCALKKMFLLCSATSWRASRSAARDGRGEGGSRNGTARRQGGGGGGSVCLLKLPSTEVGGGTSGFEMDARVPGVSPDPPEL